jgi:hypothetical protein
MIKKYLSVFFLLLLIVPAQSMKFGEVKGLFLSIGVGPRIPLGDFAETHNLAAGFSAAISYTDNQLVPLFFYGELGFQHFPGRQNYYKNSDHSSISTNMIIANFGARYYYSPLVENVVLLMPIVEAGLSTTYSEVSHLLKIGSGKNNFVEDKIKVGFHMGVGFSMFLMDVMAHYNYFHNQQYLSFDLRVRIPVFVSY